jgi:hypothetical protein
MAKVVAAGGDGGVDQVAGEVDAELGHGGSSLIRTRDPGTGQEHASRFQIPVAVLATTRRAKP